MTTVVRILIIDTVSFEIVAPCSILGPDKTSTNSIISSSSLTKVRNVATPNKHLIKSYLAFHSIIDS